MTQVPANHDPENESSDRQNRLGAVILAGGQSTRLGRNKTELQFKGATFLECVVNRVAEVASDIVIVGPIDAALHQLPDHIELAEDERTNSGPLEGIRVGLKALSVRCEFCFVTSCDVPLLQPDLIRFLLARLKQSGKDAIVPHAGERIYGMTAIYRTSMHELVNQRIESGQLRVSDLAAATEAVMVTTEELKAIDPPLVSLRNINSTEDYRELLAEFD
ncbi:MAG: molybdenum cofactor guanylyltransferase [Planctomycetota bacterium]